MWTNWSNLLVDGLHFTDDGHRRYFNSVRGALFAAMNRLVGSVSLISCNYRNRRGVFGGTVIICRNHRPTNPQFESDMLVAAYSVRHSGAVGVAAQGACRARAEGSAFQSRVRAGCWARAGQGCRLAAAGLWERLLRRGHVRCAAPQTVGVFCLEAISAVLECRTGLLSIAVCG